MERSLTQSCDAGRQSEGDELPHGYVPPRLEPGPTRRLLAAALTVLALVTVLAACGGGNGTSKGSALPRCTAIWQAGKVLPKTYDGCKEPDGTLVANRYVTCASGRKLTTFQNRMWAFFGRPIHSVHGNLANDPAYKRASNVC